MRTNKKRANALLGELWAQFLQKFIPKLKTFYPNKYTVIRDEIDNKKCYIKFDFDAILCSDIYRIIGSIIKKLNTFGILNMFAEKLALFNQKAKKEEIQVEEKKEEEEKEENTEILQYKNTL